MAVFKPKQCDLCFNLYTPSNPNQKYCPLCKEEGRKITDRARDRNRSRKANNYIEYQRYCKSCGILFKTFYKKKEYCGAKACNNERIKLKNKNYHFIRDKNYLKVKALSYYKTNREACCLKKSIDYRKYHNTHKKYVFGVKPSRHTKKYVTEYAYSFGYILLSEYTNNTSKIILKCPHGHIWETSFHSFKDANARCLHCYIDGNYVSRIEQKLRNYYIENFPHLEIRYNDRKQIYPKELDLYFPKQKIAVEVCGLFWHSEEAGKPPNYHYGKMIKCYEKDIQLITVFENDINQKFDIVTDIINKALGYNSIINSEHCYTKIISEEELLIFLNNNSIKKSDNVVKAFGIIYNDIIVGVTYLYKNSSFTHDVIGLSEFCFLKGLFVNGGNYILFLEVKNFLSKSIYKSIHIFCDLRYNKLIDYSYTDIGFSYISYNFYSPHYVKNGSIRTYKYKSKDYLKYGYDRIWDCGFNVYSYQLN